MNSSTYSRIYKQILSCSGIKNLSCHEKLGLNAVGFKTNFSPAYQCVRPRPTLKTEDEIKTKYDAIIIGGGHNGLITAFYLAQSGKQVCVLERRHTLGGAAVTEEIIPDFKFSRASYVLGLLRPHIYRDLRLKEHGLKIYPRNPSSYTPVHEKYWSKFSSKSLSLGPDENQNHKEISKFSSKDAEAFSRYEMLLNTFIEALSPLLDSNPPDLKLFNSLGTVKRLQYLLKLSPLYKAAKQLGPDATKFLQLMTAPTTKILDQWFESEPLKATLATDSVIGAMMSPQSPGSGYVLLHHVMAETNGIKGAWGFPEGGMGSVTQAMAKAAAGEGADLFVNQPVSEILVDSEGVRGVKTENGTQIASNLVLSNATPKVTFLDLLPDGSLPSSFVKEVRSIDYSSPVCKINVALKNIPNFVADPNPNVVMPHHQSTIHLNCEDTQFIDEAFQEARRGLIPTKPLIELTLPSSCDPTLAPKGCHVALLLTQYVPQLSDQNGKLSDDVKSDYVQRVFDAVEDYAPGFKSSIIGFEALMPSDLERIFGLTGGNIFHGGMSIDQLYTARPTSFQSGCKTPIRGLYLCGSGAHPGGGVMGAPGYLAANTVLQSLPS